MKCEERKPPAELEPYIKCFWYLDRDYSQADDGEVLWPDGCYEIIFHFGAGYEYERRSLSTSFLIGSLTHFHTLKADGPIRLFGARLKPFNPNHAVDLTFIGLLSSLYQSPSDQDLQAVVKRSNYSQRQFERNCLELVGLSPKKLLKVSRFNQVRLKIFYQPDIDLHDCMNEFGYYDYAHFSKDFKECLGLTPFEYKKWMLEKMKRAADPNHDVVFLQDDQ